MSVLTIINSLEHGGNVNHKDVEELLKIPNGSSEFYELIKAADKLSRINYNNQGKVFAQIGLNAEPCSKNCKFCSMAANHYVLESRWKKDTQTVINEVKALINDGVDDIFLMTTADYPQREFLKVAAKVRDIIPDNIRFVANIGDFNTDMAKDLKSVGFTGAYHINRLREGIDTSIESNVRITTLNAITDSSLELYYCVEPIGPEHSYEEIAVEIMRAKEYSVKVMAVMRRIPVPGTALFKQGQIPLIELTKIAAVTRLVTSPSRAMNAHEPNAMALLAGVNQLYAEVGANPRDTESNTEKGLGTTVAQARKLLWEAGYIFEKP